MITKQNILRSTFCSILIITVASSAPIGTQELNFDPISYPAAYSEYEYVDPVNVYEFASHKTKRQTFNVLTHEGGGLLPEQRLPLTFEKLKEFLQVLNKPKKSGIFQLNGWSASGMPFNVLYSPNTLQQRFLAAVNAMAGKKGSAPVPTPQPLRRENYVANTREDKKEYLRGSGTKMTNRSSQMRRHYLVIPQLFVSYGWGSAGK